MIRTFVIPTAIVLLFLSVAATLMATAPVLEPANDTPTPLTVRVRTIETESIELKVHSQGTVAFYGEPADSRGFRPRNMDFAKPCSRGLILSRSGISAH